MTKKSKAAAAKRSRARRAADRQLIEDAFRKQREEQNAANRAAEEEADRVTRRRIEGPCPRCNHTPLVLYDNAFASEPGVNRYDLVVTEGAPVRGMIDAVFETVEWTRNVDALIYCPNCGALHELGGETTYPDSGVTGLPKEEPESDVITPEDLQAQAETANHVRKLFEGLSDPSK